MPPTGPRWIDYLPLDELVPASRNPKGHDLDGIRASIERLGMVEVAAVMDERTGRIVGGHGRTEVLGLMAQGQAAGAAPPDGVTRADDGRWLVPVYRGWRSRSDADAEVALIGVNHLVTAGGWRRDELAELLTGLAASEGGLVGTGYTDGGLADLLASLDADRIAVEAHDRARAQNDGDDPDVPPIPAEPVTRRGDVWLLGPHRLMCGDSRDADDVATLLDGATINVALTSPPYADRRKYDESSGFRPIPPDEYVAWFAPVAANVAAHLVPDGSWFVNIKPGAEGLDTDLYVIDLVAAHVRQWGWHFATEFCWERVGVPKEVTLRFKNQWESVFQFARGRWKMRPDNVRHPSESVPVYDPANRVSHDHQGIPGAMEFKGKRGAGRGNTSWVGRHGQPGGAVPDDLTIQAGLAYPGNRLPTFQGTHEALGHSAAFPVGLPAWFIRAYTDEGDGVFDPFTGSGSTLLAAHQEGRRGFGMELSPGYCDVTLVRWQRHTGVVPTRDGIPHDFLAP